MNEIYRIADRKPEFPCWVWLIRAKVWHFRLLGVEYPENFSHWTHSATQPTDPPSEKELSLKQKLGIDPVVDDRKALGHDYDSTGVGAAADDTERIEFLERQRPFGVRMSWGFVDTKGGIAIRPAPPGCDPKFSYATFREAVDAARLYFTPVPQKGAEKLSNVVPQTPPPLPPQPASEPTDAQMLDWLDKNGQVAAKYIHSTPCSDHDGNPFWKVDWVHGDENRPSLRQAIRAAMSKGAK